MEDTKMAKTEFIRARVDEQLKENVEKLFSQLGLTMTDAITLFLKQCELNNGLPFEVKIPNEKTEKVFQATDKEEHLKVFNNTDEMFRELKI
jgi:DNA-damage-inducible protein J